MTEKDYLYDLLVHDLRGPLSVISASTKSLLAKGEKQGGLSGPQQTVLERILRNAKRIQGMIEELVEVSRSQVKHFTAVPFSVEQTINQCLIDVLEYQDVATSERMNNANDPLEAKRILAEMGVYVVVEGRYGRDLFCHDHRKIQHVIRNLVDNALKYRKNRIEISIWGDDDLFIAIKDDGAGIPSSRQNFIYKRFSHLDDASRAIPSLGLGLFCVKTIVEEMEGDIRLTSAEGAGSTFVVRIPCLKPEG